MILQKLSLEGTSQALIWEAKLLLLAALAGGVWVDTAKMVKHPPAPNNSNDSDNIDSNYKSESH